MPEASLLRAALVVTLGATRSSLAAEQLLHQRRIVFVPDTIAAGGRFLALELSEQGAGEEPALEVTATRASERLAEILERSPGEPLAEAIRAYATAVAAEAA